MSRVAGYLWMWYAYDIGVEICDLIQPSIAPLHCNFSQAFSDIFNLSASLKTVGGLSKNPEFKIILQSNIAKPSPSFDAYKTFKETPKRRFERRYSVDITLLDIKNPLGCPRLAFIGILGGK